MTMVCKRIIFAILSIDMGSLPFNVIRLNRDYYNIGCIYSSGNISPNE